jgi:hypothetical protein
MSMPVFENPFESAAFRTNRNPRPESILKPHRDALSRFTFANKWSRPTPEVVHPGKKVLSQGTPQKIIGCRTETPPFSLMSLTDKTLSKKSGNFGIWIGSFLGFSFGYFLIV